MLGTIAETVVCPGNLVVNGLIVGATGNIGSTGSTGSTGCTGPAGLFANGTNPSEYLCWNGTNWVSKGYDVTIGTNAITIGPGSLSVAIGSGAGSTGSGGTGGYYTVAIGNNAGAGESGQGNYSIAIGSNSNNAGYTGSVALGYNSQNTASNQIILGTSAEAVFVPGKIQISPIASPYGLHILGYVRTEYLTLPTTNISNNPKTLYTLTFDGVNIPYGNYFVLCTFTVDNGGVLNNYTVSWNTDKSVLSAPMNYSALVANEKKTFVVSKFFSVYATETQYLLIQGSATSTGNNIKQDNAYQAVMQITRIG